MRWRVVRVHVNRLLELFDRFDLPAVKVEFVSQNRARFRRKRSDRTESRTSLRSTGRGRGEDATDGGGDVSASVEARIDGNPVTVDYAGPAPGFVGLNQFNVVLSAGINSGTHTLVVARHGVQGNAVTISIRAPIKPEISSAQAEPNRDGPVCNIFFFCETIVFVTGGEFQSGGDSRGQDWGRWNTSRRVQEPEDGKD